MMFDTKRKFLTIILSFFRKKVIIFRWKFEMFVLVIFSIGVVGGFYLTIGDYIHRVFAFDATETWSFASAPDYNVSSSSSMEVASNVARLKVQNYDTDANTVALYHLDEANGASAADSSGNSNTGTVANGTFGAGNLNNGLSFGAAVGGISAADSASLSLSQNNTIEAWTKFNNTFSSTSHTGRQVIADKGSYQLYYNNEDGKIAYELGASSGSWAQEAGNEIKGSWDYAKPDGRAQVLIGTDLYVGTGYDVGDAEVYKWNGTTWTMIGGDGINSGWSNGTFEYVYSLATDGTNIYAGLGTNTGDAEVWLWNGTAWTKIGGDAINASWALATYETVYSLWWDGVYLYAGIGNSTNDAEVWRWNGTAWTKVGGDGLNSSWNTNYEIVQTLFGDGTYIYAGLGNAAGDAEVWRCTGCSGVSPSWTKIGGDAVNSSWADSTFEYVAKIISDGTYLYAGLGASAGDAEVWRCTGCDGGTPSWTKVGGDAINSSWADSTFEYAYGLAYSGGYLYAGLGADYTDGEVWRCTGCDGATPLWAKVGGDGLNNSFGHTTYSMYAAMVTDIAFSGTTMYALVAGVSWGQSLTVWTCTGCDGGSPTWTDIGGNYVNNSWGSTGFGDVRALDANGNYVYAGTSGFIFGVGEVWRFDGTAWQVIGYPGASAGWLPNTYQRTDSLAHIGGYEFAGMGGAAGGGDVWRWNGSVWTQVGGDAINSSWATTTYETVWAMASDGAYLYAGLGTNAGEAEIWRCTGCDGGSPSWTKVGGDAINTSWANSTFENVYSLTAVGGYVYAGLGWNTGDAEIWRCTGCDGGSPSWTKVGGDGVGSSWNTNYEFVDSMGYLDGFLYAGLAGDAGDSEVWRCTGCDGGTPSWTKVGGDSLNSGWNGTDSYRVRTIAVFDGELYAGVGYLAAGAAGQLWKCTGCGGGSPSWTKVGGDNVNSSWSSAIEAVTSMVAWKGRLYAALGVSANADAQVWSYAPGGYLESSTVGQDTDWHHIAATYNGSTMKIYIDGTLDASTSASLSLPDSSNNLSIGFPAGNRGPADVLTPFDGEIDEVRISDTARTSFTTSPYAATRMTVQPTAAVWTSGIKSWDGFSTTETLNGGAVAYRLSIDGGTTWKYWSGAWVTSSSTSQTNTAADINTNIGSLSVTSGGLLWQAVLFGNGNQQVILSSVSIDATTDLVQPTVPTALTALDSSGGATPLTTATWYNYATPYFSWTGATDTGGSGIAGYYVYFGTDNTAVPQTAGSFQAGAIYTGGSLTSGSTYYLRIQTKDNAQNIGAVYAPFSYKYDGVAPANPSAISAPVGYASSDSFTFSWPAGTDASSLIAGYQYQIGASVNPASWSSTTTETSLTLTDVSYGTGENLFFLRTLDNAGNVSGTNLQASFFYAGEGPTVPQSLAVTPESNTSNSFAFSWDPPVTYSGDAGDLTYCYTINTLPTVDTCTFTAAGDTDLNASSFATQYGDNTFYVTAKNPDSEGGAINYGAYASTTFTADTSAPGIPIDTDIADVSVKSTESWKLAVSWEAPTDLGAGVAEYDVYRSTDNSSFSKVASTSGIAYVDTGLDQETYYYKVRACDNVNNCGAFSTVISLLPTGKYTDAAGLTSGPTVSGITTRSATISWSTDRDSDSKISYGKGSGDYYDEEPSNSDQVTDHEINLSNLSPGKKYYYRVKWTDEDGNTGLGEEKTFKTDPAPTVTDPQVKSIGLDSAVLEFTENGASKVKIYYGSSTAFGNVKEMSVSATETTYAVAIDNLSDGTKYYYKINTFDSENEEYDGSVLTFETLVRPHLSDVRIQQVKGAAQSVLLITWKSNTEVSSIISYFPDGDSDAIRDEVNIKLAQGEHRMVLSGLLPQTGYSLTVRGKDKAGNEAVSDLQRFTTATDTRPPLISRMNVEGAVSLIGSQDNQQASAQLIVSWNTDEPATSQVEFGEGTGTAYQQRSQEDGALVSNHTVVISNLTPSKVYHLRVVSKDKAGNVGNSVDMVTITPKATEDALDLVITSLKSIFSK